MKSVARFFLVTTLLGACGKSEGPPPTCEEVPCTFDHGFGAESVAPGQERDGFCQIWDIGNATELWVSKVVVTNDGGYHHSNWFFVPNDIFDMPDGRYDCETLNFDELSAAIAGGVLFAQSTQSTDETQQFPAGAAVRIPPYSRIVASSHILNVGDGALSTEMRVHLETIPIADVSVKLAPFRLTYYDLHIPPGLSEFTVACDFAEPFMSTLDKPLDLHLYYALPHAHEMADEFRLELSGGTRDGEIVYQRDGLGGETWGKSFDQPLTLGGANGATGFSFTCGFDNQRGVDVGWGIGDQEMCVMLGFAESELAFDGSVGDGDGAQVGEVAGRKQFTGPCSVLAVPFFQDKGGGDPS